MYLLSSRVNALLFAAGPSPIIVEALTEQVKLLKGCSPVMVRLVLLVLVVLTMMSPELQMMR